MEFVNPIRDKKQIDAIKKYLKGSNIRDYCIFVLGINSALRVSDLISLKISDVLDDKNKIKDRIILREKKTSKFKDFPISENAKKAISEYLLFRKTYTIQEPLFLSRKSAKQKSTLQRDQIYKIINRAARSVGIKDKIGSHTMRKTFAYFAYNSGIDLSLIQKMLNHSAPSITLNYIGITQDQMDDVYLNLNL